MCIKILYYLYNASSIQGHNKSMETISRSVLYVLFPWIETVTSRQNEYFSELSLWHLRLHIYIFLLHLPKGFGKKHQD